MATLYFMPETADDSGNKVDTLFIMASAVSMSDKATTVESAINTLKGYFTSGSANTAVKLKTAQTIALTGAISASGTFDGSAKLSLAVNSLDATKLDGTVPIGCIPAAALERLKIVADDTARFKLTSSDVQLGDTVKVTATGKMYLVKDESKLTTEDGYEVYTAGSAASVPWSGVTGKPSTFTPAEHTHLYAGASVAGGSATSAAKLDSNAGSDTQPVYFSGGKPVATKFALNKTVPADAVFTDTVYTHPTTSGYKHIPSGGSSGLSIVWSSDGNGRWGYAKSSIIDAAMIDDDTPIYLVGDTIEPAYDEHISSQAAHCNGYIQKLSKINNSPNSDYIGDSDNNVELVIDAINFQDKVGFSYDPNKKALRIKVKA